MRKILLFAVLTTLIVITSYSIHYTKLYDVVLGDADQLREVAERLGGDAAPAHPGDGRHAGIVLV